MTAGPWSHHRSDSVADDIEFEIKGQELQFLEIELDPGESAVAEAGALVWKDASVGMTTVFGDGSGGAGGGFMGKLLGAGKRLFSETDKDKQLLKVVESESYSNGIQKLVYDVVR